MSVPRHHQWKRVGRIIGGLAIGGGCLVFLVGRLDLGLVHEAIQSASLLHLLAALVLNLLYLTARGVRWGSLIRSLDRRLPLLAAIRISSIGICMGCIYPGIGEVTRLVLLKRRAITIAQATYVIVAERLVDLIVLGLSLLIGLAFSPIAQIVMEQSRSLMWAGSGLLLVGLGLAWQPARRRLRLLVAAQPVVRRLGETLTMPVRLSLQTFAEDRSLTIGVIGASLAAQVLVVATGWLTLLGFGVVVSPATVLLFVVVINLGLGLVPSPLGLGLYQVTGLALLAGGSISPELAVAAATGVQIVNYGGALVAAVAGAWTELVNPPRQLQPTPGTKHMERV